MNIGSASRQYGYASCRRIGFVCDMPWLNSTRRKMMRVWVLVRCGVGWRWQSMTGTYRDKYQRGVDSIEQPAPRHRAAAGSLLRVFFLPLQHPAMQVNNQRRKAQNEQLLQPNPGHVDVHSDAGDGAAGGGRHAAGGLDDEGEDVEGDEERGQFGGRDSGEFLLGLEEVDHAAEEHVEEGVDPWYLLGLDSLQWIGAGLQRGARSIRRLKSAL